MTVGKEVKETDIASATPSDVTTIDGKLIQSGSDISDISPADSLGSGVIQTLTDSKKESTDTADGNPVVQTSLVAPNVAGDGAKLKHASTSPLSALEARSVPLPLNGQSASLPVAGESVGSPPADGDAVRNTDVKTSGGLMSDVNQNGTTALTLEQRQQQQQETTKSAAATSALPLPSMQRDVTTMGLPGRVQQSSAMVRPELITKSACKYQ